MEMGPPFYARGHPNQEQGKGSTFILVRPRESNPQPPALQSSAITSMLCPSSGHLSSSARPSWEWGICRLFQHFDEFILDLLRSNKGIRTIRKQKNLKQYAKKGDDITFLNKA